MPETLLVEYKRADPEAFKREFLVDFKAGTGVEKFFRKDHIERCIKPGVIEIPPKGPSIQYVCAVDPTGGAHDWMTATVVERLPDGDVRQCLSKGWDPTEPDAPTVNDIAKEISELVAPYGITTIYGDVFGGAWVTEAFAAVGLDYETRGFGGPQKVQRASLMRELFATQRIELLDIPRQTREFAEYEKKTLHSGNVSVNHPMTKTGSDDYLDSLALATWELVGNDVKLHPPEVMQRWDSKRWKKDLFEGGSYPDTDPEESDTAAAIVAKGEGPAWTLQNWSKDWRYCQCSLGELAWLCGVGPIQMAQVLGRDTVLQLQWMRWVLSYFRNDHDVIMAARFPLIQGFDGVKDQLKKQSVERVVTYDTVGADAWQRGFLPSDWQPTAAKSMSPNVGVSVSDAFPPWTAPNWDSGHDVGAIYDGWPNRPWAAEIDRAFRKHRRRKPQEKTITKDW
jgi:hypothetical protein